MACTHSCRGVAVLLALLLLGVEPTARADEPSLAFRSAPVHLARALEIDVPVQRCDFADDPEGGLPHPGTFEVSVAGFEIAIQGRQTGLGCFTGQSTSFKPVTIATPALQPGFYRVRYTLTIDGAGVQLQLSAVYEVPSAPEPVDEIAPVFEFWNEAFNHYFLTAFADESVTLQSGRYASWRPILKPIDTQARFGFWMSPAPERVPLHRFFTNAFGPRSSHFYTADTVEYAAVRVNPHWTYEGIAGYVLPPPALGQVCTEGKPLYRYYNDGDSGAPNHRFVTSIPHRNRMNFYHSRLWLLEGVVACVLDIEPRN